MLLHRKVWQLFFFVPPHVAIIVSHNLRQGWTNTGRQFARSTKLCNVTTNICGSLAWNLLRVTLLAPRILNWPTDFGIDHFFNLLKLAWCTNRFNIQELHILPHCMCVFCVYIITNSDFCPIQHKLIGFLNRDEKCLLRGTNWVFN